MTRTTSVQGRSRSRPCDLKETRTRAVVVRGWPSHFGRQDGTGESVPPKRFGGVHSDEATVDARDCEGIEPRMVGGPSPLCSSGPIRI